MTEVHAGRVTVIEEELARMRPDMGAIEAYRKKEADYSARVKELEAATSERDEAGSSNLCSRNPLLMQTASKRLAVCRSGCCAHQRRSTARKRLLPDSNYRILLRHPQPPWQCVHIGL